MNVRKLITIVLLSLVINQLSSQVWQADLGNGTYKNPILYADYSDPDIVKVGDDFYMTASSFNCVPALPILHSKDLVSWELINYAIKEFADTAFNTPQHGKGVWAPSIDFHQGEFYIYYGDPDRGIYMVKTKDVRGDWDTPVLVKKAYGNIDPSPLWDDDGKVYMVHAFAHSRAGVNSILQVNELSADGKKIMDKGRVVFDGHVKHPVIEGPKFYKRNGYYYIFAPGGGVQKGWQTILRAKNIYGPYEDKIVLHQGNTTVNGPHQGGFVELESGESWFVHFQHTEAYGRIVHLQPVHWVDDWPIMGKDINGDGIGEPVLTGKKPHVGKIYPVKRLTTSDEFDSGEIGLQWQWQANPKKEWYDFNRKNGSLVLHTVMTPDHTPELALIPNLLLQKFPAPEFTATTKVSFMAQNKGEMAGLAIMGLDYAYIALCKTDAGYSVVQYTGCFPDNALEKKAEVAINVQDAYLRVSVDTHAICNFSYSTDGENFNPLGQSFTAKNGRWIGAKTGIFAINPTAKEAESQGAFDWFRIE